MNKLGLSHAREWTWDVGSTSPQAVLSDENLTVRFHPRISYGTAAVKGDRPLLTGRHHYWEIKILSRLQGTSVMIGVGTKEVDLRSYEHHYTSLLGKTKHSWAMSFQGDLHHNGEIIPYAPFWSQGDTIGVHLDTWRGTLQYFINNRPCGIAFSGLRNMELYPIVCSTVAESKMKIICCMSEPVSLQTECLSSLRPIDKTYFQCTFPSLQYLTNNLFGRILETHAGIQLLNNIPKPSMTNYNDESDEDEMQLELIAF